MRVFHSQPYVDIPQAAGTCYSGWPAIGQALQEHVEALGKNRAIIAVECHPGTYGQIGMRALGEALQPSFSCLTSDLFLEEKELRAKIGKRFPFAKPGIDSLEQYFDPDKLAAFRPLVQACKTGAILIYGPGAALLEKADLTVYADISHWELLQRLKRREIGNLGVKNSRASLAYRYAWSYLLDWEIGCRIKKEMLKRCDYFLEANNWQQPKLAQGDAVRYGLQAAARQPLVTAPFFDPELWKEELAQPEEAQQEEAAQPLFHLNPNEDNLLLRLGRQLFEVPARNMFYLSGDAFWGEGQAHLAERKYPFQAGLIDHTHHTVHRIAYYPPPDALQQLFGQSPLNEDYYFALSAQAQGHYYSGLEPPESPLPIPASPSDRQWLSRMSSWPLRKGECHLVPAGTLHTTGTGGQLLHLQTAPALFRQFITGKEEQQEPQLDFPGAQLWEMIRESALGTRGSGGAPLTGSLTHEMFSLARGQSKALPASLAMALIPVKGEVEIIGPEQWGGLAKAGVFLLLPAAGRPVQIRALSAVEAILIIPT